jgi:hypothetical protein
MKVGLRELLRGSRFRLLTENPVVGGEFPKSVAVGQLKLRIAGARAACPAFVSVSLDSFRLRDQHAPRY